MFNDIALFVIFAVVLIAMARPLGTYMADVFFEENKGGGKFFLPVERKIYRLAGVDAAAEQIRAKQYAEPFKADKRKVIALAIELDDRGKGLVDWKEVF